MPTYIHIHVFEVLFSIFVSLLQFILLAIIGLAITSAEVISRIEIFIIQLARRPEVTTSLASRTKGA